MSRARTRSLVFFFFFLSPATLRLRVKVLKVLSLDTFRTGDKTGLSSDPPCFFDRVNPFGQSKVHERSLTDRFNYFLEFNRPPSSLLR